MVWQHNCVSKQAILVGVIFFQEISIIIINTKFQFSDGLPVTRQIIQYQQTNN